MSSTAGHSEAAGKPAVPKKVPLALALPTPSETSTRGDASSQSVRGARKNLARATKERAKAGLASSRSPEAPGNKASKATTATDRPAHRIRSTSSSKVAFLPLASDSRSLPGKVAKVPSEEVITEEAVAPAPAPAGLSVESDVDLVAAKAAEEAAATNAVKEELKAVEEEAAATAAAEAAAAAKVAEEAAAATAAAEEAAAAKAAEKAAAATATAKEAAAAKAAEEAAAARAAEEAVAAKAAAEAATVKKAAAEVVAAKATPDGPNAFMASVTAALTNDRAITAATDAANAAAKEAASHVRPPDEMPEAYLVLPQAVRDLVEVRSCHEYAKCTRREHTMHPSCRTPCTHHSHSTCTRAWSGAA